jgi:hypothetical protein
MADNRVLVTISATTHDSDAGATADLDLGPYVAGGVKEMIGVWVMFDLGAATDTDHTYDMKFQEGATTVNSDFNDITGGGFTQVADGSEGMSQIKFPVSQRYLRGFQTLGGTAVNAAVYLGVIAIPRFDT